MNGMNAEKRRLAVEVIYKQHIRDAVPDCALF
jgi:hypothetical protein